MTLVPQCTRGANTWDNKTLGPLSRSGSSFVQGEIGDQIGTSGMTMGVTAC